VERDIRRLVWERGSQDFYGEDFGASESYASISPPCHNAGISRLAELGEPPLRELDLFNMSISVSSISISQVHSPRLWTIPIVVRALRYLFAVACEGTKQKNQHAERPTGPH
jgi:hypothetical protein